MGRRGQRWLESHFRQTHGAGDSLGQARGPLPLRPWPQAPPVISQVSGLRINTTANPGGVAGTVLLIPNTLVTLPIQRARTLPGRDRVGRVGGDGICKSRANTSTLGGTTWRLRARLDRLRGGWWVRTRGSRGSSSNRGQDSTSPQAPTRPCLQNGHRLKASSLKAGAFADTGTCARTAGGRGGTCHRVRATLTLEHSR